MKEDATKKTHCYGCPALPSSLLTEYLVSCYDESATNKTPAKRQMVYFPLQRSVSVRSRAEIIITHTPSMSDA
jgi:hypothetical protein